MPELRLEERELEEFIYDPSLVLYLPLHELDGNSFMSRDGYGHLCATVGTTWGIKGRTFATGNYISCGNNPILNFTSSAFTIMGWIYKASDGTMTIFQRGAVGTGGYRFYTTASKRLDFFTYQAAASQQSYSSTSIASLVWTHVAVTRSGVAGICYKNGVADTESSGVHVNPTSTTKNALIGIHDDLATNPYVGGMDGMAVYNYALSVDEIMRNYDMTKWRYM